MTSTPPFEWRATPRSPRRWRPYSRPTTDRDLVKFASELHTSAIVLADDIARGGPPPTTRLENMINETLQLERLLARRFGIPMITQESESEEDGKGKGKGKASATSDDNEEADKGKGKGKAP